MPKGYIKGAPSTPAYQRTSPISHSFPYEHSLQNASCQMQEGTAGWTSKTNHQLHPPGHY
eukprot:1141985-Pelagomonas_calceolata.AAC.2